MDNPIRKKHTGERGNGGQFAHTSRVASGLTLDVDVQAPDVIEVAVRQSLVESVEYPDATHDYDGVVAWLQDPGTDPAVALEFATRFVDTAPRSLPPDPAWQPQRGVTGGNEMYSRSCGGRALPADGRYRSVSEINKLIREDIKAAVAGGYLPDDLTYRVRKTSAQATTITATGLSVADYYDRRNANWYAGWNDLQRSPFVLEVERRLAAISWQYNWDGSDTMSDYWDRNFFESVRVPSPVDEAQSRVYMLREQCAKTRRAEPGSMEAEAARHALELARADLERTVGQVREVADRLGARFDEPHRF